LKLITGENSIVDMSIYFTVYTDSLSGLRQEVAKIERVIAKLGGTPLNAGAQELDAFFSALPILNDKVNFSRRLNSNAATGFFLFT
jgi:hypothetical protein